MLLIRCPFCAEHRPEIEFRYAGEAGLVRPPDPAAASDEEWSAWLWLRANPRGRHVERWRHVHGCGAFFEATRDTVTDVFEATRPPAAARGGGSGR